MSQAHHVLQPLIYFWCRAAARDGSTTDSCDQFFVDNHVAISSQSSGSDLYELWANHLRSQFGFYMLLRFEITAPQTFGLLEPCRN